MKELMRPWKLATLAAGIALLVVGGKLFGAPDWDTPISFIMAGFTYLFAGWSMHAILDRRWRMWPLMILATWWCIDGCYAIYWSYTDLFALKTMREANWPASLSLYWACGLLWYWNGTVSEFLAVARSRLQSPSTLA